MDPDEQRMDDAGANHSTPSPAVPESVTAKPPKKAGRTMPKWESETRDRIKTHIRRFQKPLTDLVNRDANEGDTRLLVTDFLCDALGYDKYEDLSTEYQVKGEFADYAVRVDRQLAAFVEVKRAAQRLNEKHLRQVQAYAVNEGVEWMILTNGQIWQAYHLTGGLPVVVDLALDVDLLGDEGPTAKADQMFWLSKEAMKRHLISDLWKEKAATSPKSVTAALMSDAVVDALRKEVRRATGYNASVDDLRGTLKNDVVRPDLLP